MLQCPLLRATAVSVARYLCPLLLVPPRSLSYSFLHFLVPPFSLSYSFLPFPSGVLRLQADGRERGGDLEEDRGLCECYIVSVSCQNYQHSAVSYQLTTLICE
jgi:hypothetical protein